MSDTEPGVQGGTARERELVVGDQIVVTVTKQWLLHHNYVRGPFTLRPKDGRHLEQVGWMNTHNGARIGINLASNKPAGDGWEPVYRLAGEATRSGL